MNGETQHALSGDRPDNWPASCTPCTSGIHSACNGDVNAVCGCWTCWDWSRTHPFGSPPDENTADRPDLDALADRLDAMASLMVVTGEGTDGNVADLRIAARILRAVAAAPGPLRRWYDWPWGEPDRSLSRWFDALADALADAVGEP